jgi:hypothetical protein
MHRCLFLLGFLSFLSSFSQDSVAYSRDFRLYEGLYLTYGDMRHNWPIPKEKILTKINKDQLDFYSKLIETDTIYYVERDGTTSKLRSSDAWGYCQNNVIYINLKRNFYRIPVFGSISYFTGTVEVTNYSPGYNVFLMNNPPPMSNGNVKELRDFLFSFYTGDLYEYSLEKMEELLKGDEAIYKEFTALSKKKKKEMSNRFIRQYNEKHPVYFPKN